MTDIDDLQAKIDDLEGQVQNLGEALALICFALDKQYTRTPPLDPEAHAAREALHLIKTYVMGRNLPDVDDFRERARMGRVREQ